MPRYKITIEYLGTNFVGWQRQNNGISVQGEIEKAIYNFSHQMVDVICAGRTDAGVHAYGQVAHFDLDKEFDCKTIIGAINYHVKPHTICITDCQLVDSEFHARFSAKRRHYVYKILNRSALSVIDQDRSWWIRHPLNIEKMQEAANFLIGRHDFTSFRATSCQAKSPVRTMEDIRILKEEDHILFYLNAQSFLHHMVRNIVGTLSMVGSEEIPPIQVKEILEKCDRAQAGMTAPAAGLFFLSVDY